MRLNQVLLECMRDRSLYPYLTSQKLKALWGGGGGGGGASEVPQQPGAERLLMEEVCPFFFSFFVAF